MTAAITDRELLELAAKAAGLTILRWGKTAGAFIGEGSAWSPLTDDGDALRLAIAMHINIDTAGHHPAAVFFHPDRGRFIHFREDQAEQGMEAAVRRAIVRAAAELGRVMQTETQPRKGN
jgi:hypothetical protein